MFSKTSLFLATSLLWLCDGQDFAFVIRFVYATSRTGDVAGKEEVFWAREEEPRVSKMASPVNDRIGELRNVRMISLVFHSSEYD
jgi:hypothetical protein